MPEAEKVAQAWDRRSWLSLTQSGGKWGVMKDGYTPVTSQRMDGSCEFRDTMLHVRSGYLKTCPERCLVLSRQLESSRFCSS